VKTCGHDPKSGNLFGSQTEPTRRAVIDLCRYNSGERTWPSAKPAETITTRHFR
jgi:hypothetical protein